MNPHHLVDSELLDLIAEDPWLDLTAENLPSARARFAAMIAAAPPAPIAPEIVDVPGMGGVGTVTLRIFRPGSPDQLRPAIYEIHGGGFVMGSAAMSDMANARLAMEHDCVVVAVDYRLAPETPFPGPLDDCHAGLMQLVRHARQFGADPARIVILGESAGGGLAAALAIMARDQHRWRPAGLFLKYPMLDSRTGGPDDPYCNPATGAFRWNRASNRFGWTAMLGSGQIPPERLAYFSPSLATNLNGLPPTFIAVGALDLFLDEDMAFAAALARASVAVELHVYPGAVHGFDLADAEIARLFHGEAKRALARMLRPDPQRGGVQS